MFHQVNDDETKFYPAMSVKAFKELCEFIKKSYCVINPSEIKSHFSKSDKPAAIISFDDGHYDILENALPILSQLKLPFNVNIDTEVLESVKPQDFVRVYNILNNSNIQTYKNSLFMKEEIAIDRANPMNTENEFTAILSPLSSKDKRAFTDDLLEKANVSGDPFSKMLSKEDLLVLDRHNVEFGSHSHSHAILTELESSELRFELEHSKNVLEEVLNKKVNVIAYPNGVYNSEVEEMSKNLGYSVFLQTDDQINFSVDCVNDHSFKRVNQYHQNVNEALAHTFGILNTIKKVIQ